MQNETKSTENQYSISHSWYEIFGVTLFFLTILAVPVIRGSHVTTTGDGRFNGIADPGCLGNDPVTGLQTHANILMFDISQSSSYVWYCV